MRLTMRLSKEELSIRIGDVRGDAEDQFRVLGFVDGGVVIDHATWGPVHVASYRVREPGSGQSLREYLADNVRVGDVFDRAGYSCEVAAFVLDGGQVFARFHGGMSLTAVDYLVESPRIKRGNGLQAPHPCMGTTATAPATTYNWCVIGGQGLPPSPGRTRGVSLAKARATTTSDAARTVRHLVDEFCASRDATRPVRLGLMAYVEVALLPAGGGACDVAEYLERYGHYRARGWRHERAAEDASPKVASVTFDPKAMAAAISAYRRASNLL